jgi:hypothetical protein
VRALRLLAVVDVRGEVLFPLFVGEPLTVVEDVFVRDTLWLDVC